MVQATVYFLVGLTYLVNSAALAHADFNLKPSKAPKSKPQIIIGGQWYYDELELPDFSDIDSDSKTYKDYCRTMSFHYFEAIIPQGIFGLSTPKPNSLLVKNALALDIENFKKNNKEPKVNPATLNKLCKVLKIGGLSHVGVACYSDVTREKYSSVNGTSNRFSSGTYLSENNSIGDKGLTSTCFITMAKRHSKISLNELTEKNITLMSTEQTTYFEGNISPSDAIDYFKFRQLNYTRALNGLFDRFFDSDYKTDEAIFFYNLPKGNFFYKKVE